MLRKSSSGRIPDVTACPASPVYPGPAWPGALGLALMPHIPVQRRPGQAMAVRIRSRRIRRSNDRDGCGFVRRFPAPHRCAPRQRPTTPGRCDHPGYWCNCRLVGGGRLKSSFARSAEAACKHVAFTALETGSQCLRFGVAPTVGRSEDGASYACSITLPGDLRALRRYPAQRPCRSLCFQRSRYSRCRRSLCSRSNRSLRASRLRSGGGP